MNCSKAWHVLKAGPWTMDDGRWTMDDESRLCFRHAILSRNPVTQDLRKKGFLQRLCFCHAMYKYFVSRLCHTKKNFQITVSFQTKYDGIFKKTKRLESLKDRQR